VLVVPTVDDVFAFERELCGEGRGPGRPRCSPSAPLFRPDRDPPPAVRPVPSSPPAQRRRCVEVAVEELTGRARAAAPLGRTPGDSLPPSRGCSTSLQAAGGRTARGRGERRDAGGLRLPRRRRHPLRRLRGGARAQRPARRRRDRPPGDRGLLRARTPGPGLDGRSSYMDSTTSPRAAVRPGRGRSPRHTEVTIRGGRSSQRTRRSSLAGQLLGTAARAARRGRGRGAPGRPPANTESAQLYALARGFGFPELPPEPLPERSDLNLPALGGEPRRGGGDRRRGPRASSMPRYPPDEIAGRRPRPPAGVAPRSKRRWRANGIAAALGGRGAGRDDLGGRRPILALLENRLRRPAARRRSPPLPARPLRLLCGPDRLAGAGDPPRPDRRRRDGRSSGWRGNRRRGPARPDPPARGPPPTPRPRSRRRGRRPLARDDGPRGPSAAA